MKQDGLELAATIFLAADATRFVAVCARSHGKIPIEYEPWLDLTLKRLKLTWSYAQFVF